jgi:hypothetical protein
LHLAAKPLVIFGIRALGFDEVLHELAQEVLIGAVAGFCRSRKGSLQFGIDSDCERRLGHTSLLKAKVYPQGTMRSELAQYREKRTRTV